MSVKDSCPTTRRPRNNLDYFQENCATSWHNFPESNLRDFWLLRRSSRLSYSHSGPERLRTASLDFARVALSLLSYRPMYFYYFVANIRLLRCAGTYSHKSHKKSGPFLRGRSRSALVVVEGDQSILLTLLALSLERLFLRLSNLCWGICMIAATGARFVTG